MRHAEMIYSPSDFAARGLEAQELTEAIRRGLDRVPELTVLLVADLVRDHGPRRGGRTLARVAEVRDRGVVGITLGGSEQAFPPEPFEPVFAQARRLGFRTSAHAGEGAGPASVWGAIRSLRVERIGHGVRSVEDPALVEHLAEGRIPLEVCPISNLRTGVVRSAGAHPIRELLDRGVPVTVSTDDPAMFGTSLAREYELLEDEVGLTVRQIHGIVLNGARAAWLPPESRRCLEREIREHPAWTTAS